MVGQAVATTGSTSLESVGGENLEDFVTFVIAGQLFGIPVLKVQDILTPENIASIPLAPPEVRGSINLRGRIVTVIDVRVRLGLQRREIKGRSSANAQKAQDAAVKKKNQDAAEQKKKEDGASEPAKSDGEAVLDTQSMTTSTRAKNELMMGVTVEYKNELYTLLVDSVGDVIGVEKDRYESNPSTLDPIWREYASGVFRLDGNLMVVLDIGRLLNFASEGDA
ncbi:chemotaxis protein CheW [Varunaivibrio sulfuroxidans]|uniref:CheW-like protein n=1 Tax=Varunaivibrio sulfuroxidans TaxID=1773489 RepID=A0A4R3JDX8_9PROT|nr:CheW-like protein [Varunaivibrio sulfuroxidans]